MVLRPQNSMINFLRRMRQCPWYIRGKGNVLWACYSDIIYVTVLTTADYIFFTGVFSVFFSPSSSSVFWFFFFLPVISSSVYANADNVPSLVIVTRLSVSDEEKKVTALTSHQSSLWKIDIVLPSKQQLKNRPVSPAHPRTISFH